MRDSLMKKKVIGWRVFWHSDLYNTGNATPGSYTHETRARARHQRSLMKSQPWTFKGVFILKIVGVYDKDTGELIGEFAEDAR